MFERLEQGLGRLKGNRVFEFFVVTVIIVAALLAGARTYDIDPVALRAIEFLDFLITIFFVVEISLRFLAEPDKKRFFRNGWNVFDTAIVAISLVPINNSDVAVLGRLIRIFRVLRMISIIPELRMLLNSLIKALPQLGYVLMMMFIIFYIYAAIGSTLFETINPVLWGDISISMLTLFRIMTFEDWTDVMYETMEVYPISWVFYLSFIFLTAFAFLNMVIGIVVNVLEQESKAAEAAERAQEPTMSDLQQELREIRTLLQQRQ